jgi:hypothetical protein
VHGPPPPERCDAGRTRGVTGFTLLPIVTRARSGAARAAHHARMSPVNGSPGVPQFLDALSLARQGVDTGVRSFDEVAQAVASDGARGQVSATNVVDALAARNQVQASARIFSAADQMLGTLLDVRA